VLKTYNETECINTNEIIVSAKNTEFIDSLSTTKQYEIIKHEIIVDVYILKFFETNTFDVFDVIAKLNNNDKVKYAEPNFIHTVEPLNDPYLPDQWSIYSNSGGMSVQDAWHFASGEGIKVAVLDDGVHLAHPDLMGSYVLPGYDAIGNGNSGACINDNANSHGTSCAGIIVARNNEIGLRGIAYGAKIIPIRIFYKNGGNFFITNTAIASAFTWAKNAGADVISNSWQAGYGSECVYNAITDCVENGRNGKGCVVLAASGNDDIPYVVYPASHPQVIAVGASNRCDERKSPTHPCYGELSRYNTWGSNYGHGLSVVAPGVSIHTTTNDVHPFVPWSGYRDDYSGTSAACPNAAGVVALILSINPNFTQRQVRHILESTTDKIQDNSYNYQTLSGYPNGTWSWEAGYGRVNALRAVWKARSCTSNKPLDLYLNDYANDIGIEPNSNALYAWESPDIWVRRNNDSNTAHQEPKKVNDKPNYIYVRVSNKGCMPSNGQDTVQFYWSRMATAMNWTTHWNDNNNSVVDLTRGAMIGKLNIPPIQPAHDTVLVFEWNDIPEPVQHESITDPLLELSLLARIKSHDDPMTFPETFDTHQNVVNNNNIAQKSIVFITTRANSAKTESSIIVGNLHNSTKNYTLTFLKDNDAMSNAIYEDAQINLRLDDELYSTWENGGKQTSNMLEQADQTLIITGNNATLNNLSFSPEQLNNLYLKFQFLPSNSIAQKKYSYHVIQKNTISGQTVGGVTYNIHDNKIKHVTPVIVLDTLWKDNNDSVHLSAYELNEPADYNWYDYQHNFIHQGINFSTIAKQTTNYKLEIIAHEDGYTEERAIQLSLNPNRLETIHENPTISDKITVVYKINQGDVASIVITDIHNSNTSQKYLLDGLKQEIAIDLGEYSTGLYTVSLVVDGQIEDTKTLIKQ